jgi:hypothetical protein
MMNLLGLSCYLGKVVGKTGDQDDGQKQSGTKVTCPGDEGPR